MKEDLDLESTTIAAQTEEMERKKRLQEIKKSILEKEKEKEREKDSQLKSLLEGKFINIFTVFIKYILM